MSKKVFQSRKNRTVYVKDKAVRRRRTFRHGFTLWSKLKGKLMRSWSQKPLLLMYIPTVSRKGGFGKVEVFVHFSPVYLPLLISSPNFCTKSQNQNVCLPTAMLCPELFLFFLRTRQLMTVAKTNSTGGLTVTVLLSAAIDVRSSNGPSCCCCCCCWGVTFCKAPK